ncbi:hypothetical protein ACQKWADRAFT_304164 [Trichoderma austrokoningii]
MNLSEHPAAETPSTKRQKQWPSIRSSCDRCHRQKLRCRRNAESATCNRCQRLKAPCHYSRRGSKPSTVYRAVDVSGEAPSQGVAEEIGLEESNLLSPCVSDALQSIGGFQNISWPGLLPGSDALDTFNYSWDAFPLARDASYSYPLVEDRQDSDPRDVFDRRCRASKRLAALSVALYESVMPFPMLEKLFVAAERTTTAEKTRQTVRLIFDELFTHTKDFNTIMQSLHPDEALVSLIFSCHCQLAEAYTSVLNMIQAYLDHTIAPPADTNWAVVLPRLQVGSVALPSLQVDNKHPVSSKATCRMYATSIITVTALLWTQMMGAVKAVATEDTNMYASAVAVMWDAMSRRSGEVMHRIELIGSLL